MSPRPVLVRIAAAAAVLVACCAGTATAAAQAEGTPSAVDTTVPTVEGPITGPGPMYASLNDGPAGTNLSDYDYVTEEYVVSGVADGSPYRTRVVLRMPAKAHAFSGRVVAEPMHFSGHALICQYARLGIAAGGDACLEIDAETLDLGLLQDANPARYGALTMTAGQTNEILAQVGRLVRSNVPTGPFAGRAVRDVVLSGTSESSNVTRAYMGAYDGGGAAFRMPDGSPIYQGFFLTSTLGPTPLPVTDVPTVQMPTQSEVTVSSAFQRPDSDSPANPFRIYEVAGMSHADSRDDPDYYPNVCDGLLSQFPVDAMTYMGLGHLLDWVAYGITPPHAPYISVNPGGEVIDGTRVALDEYGNARGGVRTTYLDIPIYRYTIPNYSIPGSGGPTFLCSLAGFQTPLPDSVLHRLYKNRGQYLSAVNKRLGELTRQGWWPAAYTKLYLRADAKRYAQLFLTP